MSEDKFGFDFYVMRSQRMAGFCMYKGFKLLAMPESKEKVGKHVFIFKNTQQLLECIEQYKMITKISKQWVKEVSTM
ncbi:DUF5659 domain-containing protein [Desulfosporosinus sp. FKA]|uniref:DUF5659 domain-containing protein n=1 Tax=Desulfosporosinus sp. FKA TaxID=1969834 RepID=UPI001124DFD8|nr:DUF5659 domain-containing protein [Desulfosporosinus sp. FKA]